MRSGKWWESSVQILVGLCRAANQSLKLTALSPRSYLVGWGESEAVNGRFRTNPPRSLATTVRRALITHFEHLLGG